MDKRRINVRAIVWRDGKILAVKHINSDGSEAEYWAVPGGGLDPLEDLRSGVVREVFEETGVKATVGRLLFMQQFHSKREGFDEELELFFHVEDNPAFDTVDLAATSHGLDEISRVEFVDPKQVDIKPERLSELDIEAIIGHDCPVEISNEL